MDHSDVLLLARAQFGLNIAFHILFPTLTIGLAWILVYFRLRAARPGDAAWLVYDFVYTAKLANGQPFTSKGWESHGYQRTANGWRIAHLHYSVPPPPS